MSTMLTLRYMLGPPAELSPLDLAATRCRYRAYMLGADALAVYDAYCDAGRGPESALTEARWHWHRRIGERWAARQAVAA